MAMSLILLILPWESLHLALGMQAEQPHSQFMSPDPTIRIREVESEINDIGTICFEAFSDL
jgi:hypothetical protein